MKQWTQMLTQRTALVGAGLLLLAGFGSGCETTGSSTSQSSGSATQARSGDPKKTRALSVSLVSRPTNPGYSGSLPTSNYKVFIEPILDERDNKDAIGQNTEEENKPPVMIHAGEGPTPMEFIRQELLKEFTNNNLSVADSPAAAKRIITLRLLRFWTVEANTYRAEVRCGVEVKDSGGTVLWKGSVAGTNSRFGRSLKPENYQQCFSDGTIAMIGKLLSNPEFQNAISS
jgi:hypothetical protein